MELKDILSISGKPGLYKLITTSKTNIIVESLIDQKRAAVSGNNKISTLEDISIFTYEDDVTLGDVLDAIHKHTNGGKAPSKKSSSEELKDFMGEVLPKFDEDRVYVSDLKKLFSWYNLLLENKFFDSKVEEPKADSGKEEA